MRSIHLTIDTRSFKQYLAKTTINVSAKAGLTCPLQTAPAAWRRRRRPRLRAASPGYQSSCRTATRTAASNRSSVTQVTFRRFAFKGFSTPFSVKCRHWLLLVCDGGGEAGAGLQCPPLHPALRPPPRHRQVQARQAQVQAEKEREEERRNMHSGISSEAGC